VYSFVIDKYAARVVKKMKGVPTPEDIRSRSRSRLSTDTEVEAEAEIQMSKMATPSHLRTTVSKRTNVVTKYEDRLLWNQWIASEKAATMDKSSPTAAATTTAAAAITPTDLRSLCGTTNQFKYRTYVNFEEAGAICKPFYTWKRLGLMFRKPGELKFLSPDAIVAVGGENNDGGEDMDMDMNMFMKVGEKEDPEVEGGSKMKTLAFVTNREDFKLGLFIPIIIQWWGRVVELDRSENDSDSDGDGDGALPAYCIEWTQTEAQIVLPGGKRIRKLNPKISTELSSTPWDIEKVEDGMVCFRRGDIGNLVYDSK